MDKFILYSFPMLFIIRGLWNYLFYKIREKKYYKVKAKVVDYELLEDRGGGRRPCTYYFPIVEFVDNNGNLVRAKSWDAIPYMPMFDRGSTISLLVNPTDNSRFVFDQDSDKKGVPIVLILIGLFALFVIFFFSHLELFL